MTCGIASVLLQVPPGLGDELRTTSREHAEPLITHACTQIVLMASCCGIYIAPITCPSEKMPCNSEEDTHAKIKDMCGLLTRLPGGGERGLHPGRCMNHHVALLPVGALPGTTLVVPASFTLGSRLTRSLSRGSTSVFSLPFDGVVSRGRGPLFRLSYLLLFGL